MRYLLAAISLLIAVSGIPAQSVDPAMEKALKARLAALAAGDEQSWGRYTTDDFVAVEADGQTKSKAQRMAEIKGNKAPRPRSAEETLRAYGDTVIRTLRGEGQSVRRMIEVWVKEGGQWKVAHVQFTQGAK